MVWVQFILRNTPGEGLVRRPDRLAALHTTGQLRPHLGINPHPVFGQDADAFAEPRGLNGDVALQRLGNFIQDRAHVQVQGCPLIVGEQFTRKRETERLPAADSYRWQGVSLVGQLEAVPGVVVRQRGAFLVT